MRIYVETFPGLGYLIQIVRYDFNGQRLYRWADNLQVVQRFCHRIGTEPIYLIGEHALAR